MTETKNYNLNQWDAADPVRRGDFNSDNAIIDAALGEHAGQLSALAAASTKHGNCQIYTTSYVGDGQNGASAPNSLTFPKRPDFLVIVGDYSGFPLCMAYGCPLAFLDTNGTGSHSNKVTWRGNTVTWYSEHAMSQMNMENHRYYVTMFCGMD